MPSRGDAWMKGCMQNQHPCHETSCFGKVQCEASDMSGADYRRPEGFEEMSETNNQRDRQTGLPAFRDASECQ